METLEEIIKKYKPIHESFMTQQECEYADYQAYQNDLRSDLWKLTNLAIINNGYPIFCILWKRAVDATLREHFFFEDEIKATWEIYQSIEKDFLKCLKCLDFNIDITMHGGKNQQMED